MIHLDILKLTVKCAEKELTRDDVETGILHVSPDIAQLAIKGNTNTPISLLSSSSITTTIVATDVRILRLHMLVKQASALQIQPADSRTGEIIPGQVCHRIFAYFLSLQSSN